MNINGNVNADTFREATQLQTQIDALVAQRNALFGASAVIAALPSRSSAAGSASGKRTMSDAARAKIAAAQKKRWAAIRKGAPAKTTSAAGARTHTMSPAGRRKIAKAQRKRWAAIHAAQDAQAATVAPAA